MRLTALISAFGLTAMFGAGAEAESLACGGEYIIKRGDTLQQVTRMAYGECLSWKYLYNANKSVVGSNPSLIEVGMKIKVPCRRGQTPGATVQAATTSAASTTATVTTTTDTATTQVAPASPTAPIVTGDSRSPMLRLVTASNYAPFHDQNDANGGMLTEMIAQALTTVMPAEKFRIDFINDWSSHLEPLISDRSYDFALSWFKPNCSVADKLGEGSRFRCERLVFSDPLFEQIVAYFIRSGEANVPATHADLFGRTICRPAGYSMFMLEEHDLVAPNVTMVTPSNPTDCMEMLIEGEADVVVVASTVADDAISTLNISAKVEEQSQLASVITLHAVTSVDNPQKEQQMTLLNKGIQNVRESGKWFEIVQRHLVAHTRKKAQN